MTTNTMTRRAAIVAAITLPAVPAVGTTPPIVPSVADLLARAAALVEQANAATEDVTLNACGDASASLFRAVAEMPCRTMADAAAKLRAIAETDGGAHNLFMPDVDTSHRAERISSDFVQHHYMRDVIRFIETQEGQS